MQTKGHFLDFDSWPGRDMFRFFSSYQHPFFNLCAEIDATASVAACRELELSPTWVGWYHCQQVVNALEPFRYRLRQDRVWVYDRISVATTVTAQDRPFRFAYLPYEENFRRFDALARTAATEAAAETSDSLGDRPEDDAVVHGSVIPWVRFSSISHAQRVDPELSVPRIVFGRYSEVDGSVRLPVSVEVHHALVDGQAVGRFFSELERAFAEPDVLAES